MLAALAAIVVTLIIAAASAEGPAARAASADASASHQPSALRAPVVSHEIAFWSARVERDRDDHISATKLGYACLKEARRTGDFRLYAEAERALTEALRRSPGHATALLGLATARAARHRFEEAIDLARQASLRQGSGQAAEPKDPDALAIIGDAYLGLGDLESADAAYAELALRAPGFASDTRRANLLHARGKSRAAIERLRAALADAIARDLPADARAWCHVVIGATLFDLGDWDGAEPEYQAALTLTPASYVAIEHLAELRSYQRRDLEALALYDRAIALAAHPDFYEAVARTHETAGRTSDARRWYTRARDGYLAAVTAGDPGYYRNLAMYYVDVERRPADALMWAKRDLALRRDAHAWGTLGWALLANGDAAGAREASAKATATEIEDAPLWFRAGVIEKAAGRPAQAAAALRRALAINSRFDRHEEARTLLRQLETLPANR
jgi:tetratricopeptide (TPR) repeat protein